MQPMIAPSFHLAYFQGSPAVSSVDVNLTPASDGYLSQGASGLLLPTDMKQFRSYAVGAGLVSYLLNVPSLRQISQPRYGVVDKNTLPMTDATIIPIDDYGPTILQSEGFNYAVTTDATAGPPPASVFAWLRKSFVACRMGVSTTIRATASFTGVAGQWVTTNLTLSQDLPSGVYEIIGCAAYGATTFAIRFRLPGAGLAPGVLAEQVPGQFVFYNQRHGRLGTFGSFVNINVPLVDVAAQAGASTLTLYIDIVKVA